MASEEPCNHFGSWMSHPPVPIQVQNGALLLTVLYCANCGHVEYRSPPLNRSDEEELDRRMVEINNKQKLLGNSPQPIKKGMNLND